MVACQIFRNTSAMVKGCCMEEKNHVKAIKLFGADSVIKGEMTLQFKCQIPCDSLSHKKCGVADYSVVY